MVNLTVPGVKIQEISTLPPSVAPVDTAIPAFVGYTEKLVAEPKKIESFLEFEQTFGGPAEIALNTATVVATSVLTGGTVTFIDNGGDQQVTSVTTPAVTTTSIDLLDAGYDAVYKLYHSMKLFFQNGGGTCYVASAGQYDTTSEDLVSPAALTGALDKIATLDEPTLLVVPDAISVAETATLGSEGLNFATVTNHALTQAGDLKDRFVIMDTYPHSAFTTPLDEIQGFRNSGVGTSDLLYGAAYYPRLLVPGVEVQTDDASTPVITLNAESTLGIDKNTVMVTGEGITGTVTWAAAELAGEILAADSPGLEAEALAEANVIAAIIPSVVTFMETDGNTIEITMEVGPSGAIAGVYARTDFDRGVWKAPANTSISGAILAEKVDDSLQSNMNVDPTAGKSVNAIRAFTGRGSLVWGSRTLAGNDNEWRYINVRRLFNFIEESVKKASTQFVFEPNTQQTWTRIKGMIDNFLTAQWRQGAIAGAKPEDAFFVKVGLGTTMTSQEVLEGVMNIEIGLAPARPAEFIVLKFSHKLQES